MFVTQLTCHLCPTSGHPGEACGGAAEHEGRQVERLNKDDRRCLPARHWELYHTIAFLLPSCYQLNSGGYQRFDHVQRRGPARGLQREQVCVAQVCFGEGEPLGKRLIVG